MINTILFKLPPPVRWAFSATLFLILFFQVECRADERVVITTGTKSYPIIETIEPILREAYSRIGLEMQIVHYPWNRSLMYAASGHSGGELFRSTVIEKECPELLRVDVPVGFVHMMAFTKNIRKPIKSWEDLRPYSISHVRGIKIIEENTQGMNTEKVTDLKSAFKKLNMGRTDFVIAERRTGQIFLEELKLRTIRMIEQPLLSAPVYHYLSPGRAYLAAKLEGVLKKMTQEGMLQTWSALQ